MSKRTEPRRDREEGDHDAQRDANLAVLRAAFDGASNADVDAQLAHYTDDMILELPFADPPVTVRGRARAHRMLARAFETYRMRLRITAVHWCLDPDQLVVEFASNGHMTTTGKAYANVYIAVVRFRDGRICHQREFFDPTVAARALHPD